jgi:hypothetical protein
MSGSYSVLNQKYNTLLALVQGILGGSNLNNVLTIGNSTSLSAIFNTGLNTNTISGDSMILTDGTTTNTINKTGITTRNSEQNVTHYLTFVDTSTSGISAIQKTAGIECNPLNNTISATTFIGSVNTNNSNITLRTDGSAPISGTQLGGITIGSFLTPSSSFQITKNIATLTISTPGVYLICFSFQANYSTLPTINYVTITGTALPLPSFITGYSTIQIGELTFGGSIPAVISTIGTLILTYNVSPTVTGTITGLFTRSFTATRIG